MGKEEEVGGGGGGWNGEGGRRKKPPQTTTDSKVRIPSFKLLQYSVIPPSPDLAASVDKALTMSITCHLPSLLI